MDKLKEVSEKTVAHRLIMDHGFGAGFRDKNDFEIVQAHSKRSVNFALLLLKETRGTIKQKIKFLENMIEEIDKFHVKE